MTAVRAATTTVAPVHPAGVLAHGLHALADHMAERNLTPESIELPGYFDFDGLTVVVLANQAKAWTSGGFVLDQYDEQPPTPASIYYWCWADGRLADTGVRVRISWLTHIHARPALQAVKA
jgi:hypothetical protein